MELFSTRAIVLRVRNAAAADSLATLFAPRHGRLVCAAKNARRSFRRFSGCLNLFSEIEAVVASHEGREISRLESATLMEAFEGLRSDLRVLAAASAGVELVDRISRGTEESPAVYDETRRLLDTLSKTAGAGTREVRVRTAPKDLLTVFSLRVLALAGFRPELNHCVSCGRDATAKNVRRVFDLHRGGLLCPKCAGPDSARHRGLLPLSPAARHTLKEMLASGIQAPDSGPRTPVAAECSRLVESLVVERLGSPLRSWASL